MRKIITTQVNDSLWSDWLLLSYFQTMLHTNVKHEPSTYTEAITERGAQCTRYGFAQKKRNLLQETAVGIIFTMGPKNFFEVLEFLYS